MREEVKMAAEEIKKGNVVGFPTETVYGLGADALNIDAVNKIFELKGRPSDNPLIVHISSTEMLNRIVISIPPAARKLIRKYWPGPLTVIMPKHPDLPYEVTAGLETVAVRMPSHNIALALIEQSGKPIAAPSANLSGRPSPTRAEHVTADFPGLIVIDGGPCQHGVESTVIEVDVRPKVLRLGAISFEELKELVPNLVLAEQHSDRPVSPGMKYKHYSPDKPMKVFQHNELDKIQKYLEENHKSVVLCLEEFIQFFPGNPVVSLGKNSEDAAREIYHALRIAEGDEIVVLGLKKEGHGRTVMDRLEKAAHS